MKIKLFIPIITAIIVTLTYGCGKNNTNNSPAATTTYTGQHHLFIFGIDATNLGQPPVDDTLSTTIQSSGQIDIFSKLINTTLHGNYNASTGNITLDSLIFNPNDTIIIAPAGTVIKIWDVRAGGNGTLIGDTLTTDLKIAKGKTNVTQFSLDDLSGKQVELRGKFHK